MSTTLLTGFNIANVERVRIVTEETTPKTYMFRTMTSFDAEPYVNEGEEVTQRVKNTIMGRIKTDDLLEGYDISCEDERLIPQVLALVDGGTYDDEEQSYAAPAIGTEVVRTPFTLDLYTSDRGGDGEVKNYLQWTFPHCKGKPVKIAGKDNEFTKQAYDIASRPGDGDSPFTVKVVDALPEDPVSGVGG